MQEEACESSPRRTPINDVLLVDGPKSETNVAHDECEQQPRLSGFPKFRGHLLHGHCKESVYTFW